MSGSSIEIMDDLEGGEAVAQQELLRIESDLSRIDAEVARMRAERARLAARREGLLQRIQEEQMAPRKDWQNDKFSWDAEVQRILKDVFRLSAFRWDLHIIGDQYY